jgi:DNA polymerase-3 subunit alpha
MSRHFGLHAHTEDSLFDGLGKAVARVQRAVELGYTALGISDHGTVGGLIDHYKACKDAGIKPILGVEAYYQPEFNKEEPRYHLCMFAKNLQGYRNINKMITLANMDTFFRKPIVIEEYLEKYSEGVIISTACIGGYTSQLLLKEKEGKAIKVLEKWKKLFGDDLYIEIMPFTIDDNGTQEFVNRHLYDIAKKQNIKCIMTTDEHYILKEDYETHSLLFKMNDKDMGDTYVGRFMQSESQVIDACKEMHSNFNYSAMLANLQTLANSCEVDLDFKTEDTFPLYNSGKDNKQFIREIMVTELKRKGLYNETYFTRLKYELDVIESLGYVDYFLIIWDMINFCRSKGIPTGVRGSAGNSMVVNALGLSEVDPVKLGNIFERFLRHGKEKLVDIDCDCSSERRQEVVDYIEQKYKGQVATISNYGTWQTKNLLDSLCKYFKIDVTVTKKLKEIAEEVVGERDRTELVEYRELATNKAFIEYEEQFKLVTHFCKLWGQKKNLSRHAGGVAITKGDITDFVALIRSKGVIQTAYDMGSIDRANVLKLDILGVTHYDVINDIEKAVGETFSYEKIEQPEIYSLLQNGQTQGIFQLETVSATGKLEKIQPDCLGDIIAINSINRPGAAVKDYIKGKHEGIDKSKPYWMYSEDSYGAIIYQESVMMILREFAGMEWKDVDKAIKILGKDTDDARKLRDKFLKGVEGKLTSREANELYEKMTKYLFNKGHASAYAIIGAWETYLKYYYPTEFYWGVCKSCNDKEKLTYYIHHAICNGIFFLKPNVNSSANFSIETIGDKKLIRIGLSYLDGIGQGTAEYIQSMQPFVSEEEFIERCHGKKVTTATITTLQQERCFETDMVQQIRMATTFNQTMKKRTVVLK